MPLLTIQSLEKSFGDRIILDRADLLLDRGERVGLIGDNGSGKTTLFKIITREMEPEVGVVAVNKGLKIGHLTQQASFDPANPGRDPASGGCKPCPPDSAPWEAPGNKHGSTCGTHWHQIRWNQNPITCMCFPDRWSGPAKP